MVDREARVIEVIPAPMPKSFKELEELLGQVHGVAKKVQIDVVDGRFAHNKTWPYKDRASFEKILAEEQGLPFWQDFDFEFDLMIQNPEEEVMQFVQAGASHVIVYAAAPGAAEALRKLADVRDDDYGAYTIETGVALLPDMQPEVLESFDTLYDYVQVMGIKRIGHQGEPFEPHSLALIERLHKRYPDLAIQVDGAVSLETAKQLVAAGARRLVVGSAIFNSKDPRAAYNALYTEVNS